MYRGQTPRPPFIYYFFKLTSSCKISSDVVIMRVFAWNPRCATIISVNSSDKSTFDISKAPEIISPAPFKPGRDNSLIVKPFAFRSSLPELFVSLNVLPPIFLNRLGLEIAPTKFVQQFLIVRCYQ